MDTKDKNKMIITLKNIRPLSKQHGTGRNGKRSFTKPGYKLFREAVAWEAKKKVLNMPWRMEEKKAVLVCFSIEWPFFLGDDENIIGGLLDAMQGIVYLDDCQVRIMGVFPRISKEKVVKIAVVRANEADAWTTAALKKRGAAVKKRKTVKF